jgi:hypothetical protein
MNKEASIEHLLMLDISFDITLQNVNLNGAVCLVGRLHLEFNFLLLWKAGECCVSFQVTYLED